MASTRLLKVTAAVGGLAAVALLVRAGQQQQQSQEEVQALRAELAEVRAGMPRRPTVQEPGTGGVQALRDAVASLQRTVAQQRKESPEQVEETGGLGPDRAPAITYEQSQAAVLTAYARETLDPDWSRASERKLDATVRPHLPGGSQLKSVECRSTMCQLVVAHRDPNAEGSFLMEAFRGWPGSIFVAGERQERGELLVTFIASREGTEPPMGPR